MRKFDVVILGGGASGIFTAINVNINKKVAIIEKSDRLGKKILATGNGRCNLTNTDLDCKFYNTPKVAKLFNFFDNCKAVDYFSQIGLETYADTEGRCYPMSNSANSVLDILLKQVSLKSNIEEVLSTVATSIKQENNQFVLSLSNGEEVVCDKLVIATGGNAGKEYLDKLSVKYSEFVPSLVGLKTEKNKGLAGVRVSNVKVSFKDFEETGEILFKEDGISGIVIFNLSTIFARNNLKKGRIIIDLLPDYSYNKLIEILTKSCRNNPKYLISEILEGLMHKSLAKNILFRLNIKEIEANKITSKELDSIVKEIKEYKVIVTGISDNNQVHSGGVSLDNLTDKLMYKDISDLYFVGEIVDVDGACGGYNLQWAWTSGKIVGEVV